MQQMAVKVVGCEDCPFSNFCIIFISASQGAVALENVIANTGMKVEVEMYYGVIIKGNEKC